MPPKDNRTFAEIIKIFTDLIELLLPVLLGLALLAFIWGLTKFIYKSGDEKSHAEGKQLMVWGLIALFVLLSFLGIIKFVQKDVGIDWRGLPTLPEGEKK